MSVSAALIWDPSFVSYRFKPNHPFNPKRLELTVSLIEEMGLLSAPDVKLVKPFFYKGRRFAVLANCGHWTDIGGAVPGGFGVRGIEGKVRAASMARTKKVPYLGICLGMQVAVIEFAFNSHYAPC